MSGPRPGSGVNPLACHLGDVFTAAQDDTKTVVCSVLLPGGNAASGALTYQPEAALTLKNVPYIHPERLFGSLTEWVPDPSAPPSTPGNPSFGFKSQAVGDVYVYRDWDVLLNNTRLNGLCWGWTILATGPDGGRYAFAFEIIDKPK